MKDNKLYIIMEYAESGDLKALIHKHSTKNSNIDEEIVSQSL
jgi:hypothetical protein